MTKGGTYLGLSHGKCFIPVIGWTLNHPKIYLLFSIIAMFLNITNSYNIALCIKLQIYEPHRIYKLCNKNKSLSRTAPIWKFTTRLILEKIPILSKVMPFKGKPLPVCDMQLRLCDIQLWSILAINKSLTSDCLTFRNI
jgi:hypothetical protein